jgi:hypothetical protein
MESAERLEAGSGGFDGVEDKHEPQSRARLELIQGEALRTAPRSEEPQLRRVQLAPAPELQRQDKTEERESASARREAVEGRAKLRAALLERLAEGMADVEGRLSQFLKNPGRLGVVNLSLVLSESSLTYEVWKDPSTVPERRARMALTLGVDPAAEDALVLAALMAEVHEAFVAYQASPQGREARQRYGAVLQSYDAIKVLPVVPGHDTGPMLAELARVGLEHRPEFSRSLLVDPLLLSVGLAPDEGSDTQVMVAGLNVPQLGTLVAHLRRLNPRMTNRQVCQLLLLATTERKTGGRKFFGEAELELVQEFARRLLRLQVVELLFV